MEEGAASPFSTPSNIEDLNKLSLCFLCSGWLQWNAATECNIMLPLAAFPMHCCPAARCNPILPSNSKRSRLPNPAIRGGMATPVGATGSKVRFARHPGAIQTIV